VLIIVVVLLAFVYFRQASPPQQSNSVAPPTAVPNGSSANTNQSNVNDEQFYALLGTINRGLDDATDVIKTAVQKN